MNEMKRFSLLDEDFPSNKKQKIDGDCSTHLKVIKND